MDFLIMLLISYFMKFLYSLDKCSYSLRKLLYFIGLNFFEFFLYLVSMISLILIVYLIFNVAKEEKNKKGGI